MPVTSTLDFSGGTRLPSAIPQWIQDINTGLSLLGFGITLYVLFEVKFIKSTFLSRARLPELIRDLEKAGSVLNGQLGQWPAQRNEALCQIKVAASLLKSASAMVPKTERDELLKTHEKLTGAAKNFSSQQAISTDFVWDLYSDIQSSIASMTQVSKNNRWE